MKLEPLSGLGNAGDLAHEAQTTKLLRAINSHGETNEESNQGIDL